MSGGDGMGGLALAIFAAMVAMVVGAIVVLGGGSFLIARLAGATLGRALAVGALGALVGVGIGLLAVTATFYESTFSPPPAVRFELAPGADPRWIVLLEDPQRGAPLAWSGVRAPFLGRTATVAVPASGIARVKSLSGLAGSADAAAIWPDGATSVGFAGGPAPPGANAAQFCAWTKEPWEGPGDELPMGDELARYIREREAPGR